MDNLTAVVTFRNGHSTIEHTLDSLPADLPIVVVDDLSDIPYQTSRPNVRVVRMAERGYPAGACNTGMQECATDVLLLGQDNVLTGEAWKALVAQRETFGVVGDAVMGHPAFPKGYVQATWMLMRRDAINKVGLFNAKDYPAWGCTSEWQLRACRQGFKALPTSVPGLEHARQDKRFGQSMVRALAAEPHKRELFLHTPPAISVVIPCYNYGRYLGDAVNSLLGGTTCLGTFAPQSWQSFEIIIVDDASTDDSYATAKALANDWQGVHVYRNAVNAGTAQTINAGIRKAHGKYIAVLSADDMMEPTRLEQLYRAAEANPHSAVYDDMRVFQQGKRTQTLRMMHDYDFEVLLKKNMISYALLYPRKAWEEVGGYPVIFDNGREDWAFNVALGAKGYCGIHIAEPLFLYRRDQQNRSLRNSGIDWRAEFVSKMHATFPNLYRGERPTMCCGSKATRVAPRRNASVNVVAGLARTGGLPGGNGMVRLEFVAKHSSTLPFHGAETQTVYAFGGHRKLGWVAAEDVDDLLQRVEGGKPIFRLAPVPTPPVEQAGV